MNMSATHVKKICELDLEALTVAWKMQLRFPRKHVAETGIYLQL